MGLLRRLLCLVFDVCAMLIAFALLVGIWFWCWLLSLVVCGALACSICVCVLRFALWVFGGFGVLLFLVKFVVFILIVLLYFGVSLVVWFLFDLIIDGCIWCRVFVDLIAAICCCLVFVRLVS